MENNSKFMIVTLILAMASPALADDNIKLDTHTTIPLLQNTSLNVPLNFTNFMNVSAQVTVSGNTQRLILPVPFFIDKLTFMPRYMIITGAVEGTFNENLSVSYVSDQANGSFIVSIVIIVANNTENITTNQTQQNQTNQSQICQENCSLNIQILQPPQNATYIRVRDIQGFVNVRGSFSEYACTKILDDSPESIGTIPNNTEEPFVLLNVTFDFPHTLKIRCRAGTFLNESETVTFISKLNGTATNGTIQPNSTGTGSGLTREQAQALVNDILNSRAKELEEELKLREQLNDYSCLYSEERVEEMNKKYKELSSFARECLPSFIDSNQTTYQFFAFQCPFIQGDYQAAAIILQEYDRAEFAKKQAYIQQIQYTVTKGGEGSVVSQPIQQFFYYPVQITNGCIAKFEQLENRDREKANEGYASGMLLVFLIVFGILGTFWYTSQSS